MSVQAESRCDCATILDTCSATVSVEQNWVSIESDHLQCARVDYLIDGEPFVALVVEGSERQSWLSRSDNPDVVMQSCQVCLDNAGVNAAVNTPVKPAAESEPARLLAVNPRYPASAVSSGIDGFVEVSYTVTPLGRVEDASVTAAEPPGIFEQSALTAISRWRYDTDERRQAVTLRHRFDFESADAVIAKSAPNRFTAEAAIDDLIARQAERRDGEDAETTASEPIFVDRNHCIREEASYDFGQMIEVDLMNACSEPLIVYSCAQGTDRYYRRWVCQSTENTQSILVRPGDRLAGNAAMIEIPEGVSTFTYAEDLFVARPPNTEYWWLACSIGDAECRGSGRQWVRSMIGKAANIDPQLWTQQSVARAH